MPLFFDDEIICLYSNTVINSVIKVDIALYLFSGTMDVTILLNNFSGL